MRDANENILKMIVNNVHESVDFLEKFVSSCSVESLTKPTSECFQNLNQTSQASQAGQPDLMQQATPLTANANVNSMFNFEWDKAALVPLQDIKNMVYIRIIIRLENDFFSF